MNIKNSLKQLVNACEHSGAIINKEAKQISKLACLSTSHVAKADLYTIIKEFFNIL